MVGDCVPDVAAGDAGAGGELVDAEVFHTKQGRQSAGAGNHQVGIFEDGVSGDGDGRCGMAPVDAGGDA